MLISIIIPTFNSERYLSETILSILNQDFKNFEIIVIDSLSTDKTQSILKTFNKKISKIIYEKDNNMYEAINKGLRLSKGDIVSYLNSDDLYTQGTLKKVHKIFYNNKEIKFLYGNCILIDENSKKICNQIYPKFNRNMMITSKFSLIGQPSTFFRREIFEYYGYFNESYSLAADYDYYCKISKKIGFYYSNSFFSKFRQHRDSQSSKGLKENLLQVSKIHKINLYNKNIYFIIFYRYLGYLLFKFNNLGNYFVKIKYYFKL